MDQNLSGYKIFYEVASCGNISKAAKKLYISQPAISKSIVKLEDGLDTKLFHRNSRGVTLTEEGTVLYRYIKDAFDNINNAETELKRMKDFNIGHLQIGVSTTLCRYILLPYLQTFMQKYPNIRVSIITQSTAQTLALLEQKKIDIGLTAEPRTRRPELRFVHPKQIHDTFVASDRFAELETGVVELKRLQDYPLLMLELSTATRQAIVSFAHSQGIHLHPEIELASLELMAELAKSGIGIACIPREFVSHEINSGSLKEIITAPALPARAIGLCLPKGENLTFAVKEFLKMVTEGQEKSFK